MKTKMSVLVATGFVAAGFVAAVGVRAADEQRPTSLPQITVQASFPTPKKVGRTGSGVPIQEVELRYYVSYDDLDIATDIGMTALEGRIKDAATEACKELDRLYPLMKFESPTTASNKVCYDDAVSEAMVQAKAAAAAAQH